eukprot:CAMPEP_0202711486 /NCGR_PEP_ID=MMETSP1385-20130828/23290_1 /ASSEMBLY_ACC=CAM_ASM_000861 /TAXON_ID=933848 /ORGANISM="Elphidium margaritaceum" /LENGTH=459 /DNA_ID=CAMNT_0049371233 /DNA_START=25 /DNA_END=1404 /DNA_ORIENTATION=-
MLLLALLFLTVVNGKSERYNEYNHTATTAEGRVIETLLEANEPTVCDPNVQQYSGYLSADGANKYFYWFFESRTNPENAPLIMWLTGGPGCSSQLALLVENGPCNVIDGGKNTKLNPYSWNTNSHIMWVDQPPGTGFSTGRDVSTEDQISQDMWAFLQNFIGQFPKYFANGFYVVGESYGGHYVPNVMNEVWKQNNAGAGTYIPIKGFAVGNGLTDPYIQFAYYAQMAYNSSSAVNSPFSGIPISETLYERMTKEVPECQSAIETCNDSGSNNDCDSAYQTCMENQVEPVTNTGVNPYNLHIPCGTPGLCYDFTAETTWLNNATVQEQIGVDMKWESCNTLVNIRLESDWMKDYQQKITQPIETNVRGLIYAGDLDFICNWLGNQAWALALPWSAQAQFDAVTPSKYTLDNGTTVGEIRQVENLSNFTFVRIYEAGHMVPMDQPAAALKLINDFISDTL